MSKLVVEVMGKEKIENVYCPPAGATLRCHFNPLWTQDTDPRVKGLPDTPGQCIALDLKGRKVKIYDPLENETYGNVRAAWNKARLGGNPQPSVSIEVKTEIEWANWINWIRNSVGCNDLRVIEGELPPAIVTGFSAAEQSIRDGAVSELWGHFLNMVRQSGFQPPSPKPEK